jgi:archaemetzincin
MTRKAGAADPSIYLWWIGAEAPPGGLLDEVRAHTGRVFGLTSRLWRGHERPPRAFDPARNQSSSTRILEWLVTAGPGEAHKVLAVTDMDLFIPVLTFVFGEAQLGGHAAVVSTARLVPSGSPIARGGRLLAARLTKEAVHEIGHSFGLVHCDLVRCVMSRSSSLLQVDAKSGGLCQDCWTRYLDLREHSGGPHDEGTHPYPGR